MTGQALRRTHPAQLGDIRLGDMRPCLTANNQAYIAVSDFIASCKFATADAVSKQLSNTLNIRLCEFCEEHRHALPTGKALTNNHVIHVVPMRTQIQVLRVYARRIITVMENPEAVGHWPIGEFIGYPVCPGHTVLERYSSMPMMLSSAKPKPTSLGLLHSCPEARFIERTADLMPTSEGDGLSLDMAAPTIGPSCKLSGFAAAAFAKVGAVKRQLDRGILGWYTHVTSSLYEGLVNPRLSQAARGFLMPYYSTFERHLCVI